VSETARFTKHAGSYALHRPAYPVEALDAVLEDLDFPIAAADLGAGTGISSRLLAQRGVRVVAVEPNAAMCAQARAHPLVAWRTGTAEATGLPDKGVDLTTAFQAFHWFANETAIGEMTRITRRRVVLVQYERDAGDAFSAEYGSIVLRYALDDTEARRERALELFREFPGAVLSEKRFRHGQLLTLEGLLGRAASSSYLPQGGASGKSLQSDLRKLFETYANRNGLVTMLMIVYVLRADLVSCGP